MLHPRAKTLKNAALEWTPSCCGVYSNNPFDCTSSEVEEGWENVLFEVGSERVNRINTVFFCLFGSFRKRAAASTGHWRRIGFSRCRCASKWLTFPAPAKRKNCTPSGRRKSSRNFTSRCGLRTSNPPILPSPSPTAPSPFPSPSQN